jgi:hypothetical protein
MAIDIRLPIGLLFTVLGAILAAFGVFSDPAIYARALGYNVNLWWGLALLAFGFVLLSLAYRRTKRTDGSSG